MAPGPDPQGGFVIRKEDLNAHGPGTRAAVVASQAAGPAAEIPAELAHMPEDRVLEIDVREDLRNGKEPFSRIMAARRDVPPGGALRVRAIFEPVPLYSVMEKQGFARHHAEQLGVEDWRVWFYAAADGAEPTPRPESAEPDRTDAGIADDVIVLDVRGLEPPEPMVRTLAALESLPVDATLVQINVRVPQFLLPLLDERGFTYEIREQQPELVRLFIRRAPADRAVETVDTQQVRISE